MQESDVFDMLVACADFETFKELMLSHKLAKEGGGISLTVNVRPLAVHIDEQVSLSNPLLFVPLKHPRISDKSSPGFVSATFEFGLVQILGGRAA